MNQVFQGKLKTLNFLPIAILMAGAATTLRAEEWQAVVGAESRDRGSQALAFLPNEVWVHTGDSILWIFPTHERHTVSFLKPGQTRPPAFGPTFGVLAGCPGLTPDGSSFDGSACVTSDILLLGPDAGPNASGPTYSVQFPSPGNFKFVCLVHNDMTGVVHVLNLPDSLPHNQQFYDHEAQKQAVVLLADASRMEGSPAHGDHDRVRSSSVAVGKGEIVTSTGAGSQSASLMRFQRHTIVVQVGDTWNGPAWNHRSITQ